MNIGLLKFGFIQTGLSILQNGKLPQFIPDDVIASEEVGQRFAKHHG